MTPDAAHHFFVLSILTLATIFVIAAMRGFVTARGGRVAATQSGAAFDAMRGDLAEMKSRLAAVETMLREVG